MTTVDKLDEYILKKTKYTEEDQSDDCSNFIKDSWCRVGCNAALGYKISPSKNINVIKGNVCPFTGNQKECRCYSR